MSKESNATPDILMIAVGEIPNPFADIAADAEDAGMQVAVELMKGSRMRAAALDLHLDAQWILFLLAPPYAFLFKMLLEKHAPSLWRKFFDRDNPDRIRVRRVSAHGELQQKFSGAMSIWAAFRHGTVRLLIPEDCSEEVFSKSTRAFAELMRAYANGETYAEIDLDSEQDCYFDIVLVTFDEDEDCLRVLNPWEGTGASAVQIEHHRAEERKRRSTLGVKRKQRIEPTVSKSDPAE